MIMSKAIRGRFAMFTKKFRKVTIAALVALSIFFVGGLSQLAAFSVDVKKLYYLESEHSLSMRRDLR